jgi:large subunit ribosomal protein L7Ae
MITACGLNEVCRFLNLLSLKIIQIKEEYKMAEISKEIIDKIYEAVEVAKATGRIKKGSNEVTKAIEKGTAKLVAIAKNVNPPEITMHIPLLSKEKDVLCVEVPSKEELGAAAGISVGTASIAIIEEGEAKNTIKEIIKKLKE